MIKPVSKMAGFFVAKRLCYTKGMIKTIILALIVIIILSFFGYDLRAIVEDPLTQNNLHYVTDGIVSVWHKFLKKPVEYLWDKIFVGIIWDSLENYISRIDIGGSSDPDDAGQRFRQIGTGPCKDRLGC